MYKEALRNIQGLEISAAISVLIFFCFFVGLFFYVLGYKKKHLDKMEAMPLDEKEKNDSTIEKN